MKKGPSRELTWIGHASPRPYSSRQQSLNDQGIAMTGNLGQVFSRIGARRFKEGQKTLIEYLLTLN